MEGGFRRRPSQSDITAQNLSREHSAEYLQLSGAEEKHEHGVLVRTLSRVMLDPNEAAQNLSRIPSNVDVNTRTSFGTLCARAAAVSLGCVLLALAAWRSYLRPEFVAASPRDVLFKVAAPAVGSGLCWLLAFSPLPTLLRDRHHRELSVDPTPFPVFFTAHIGWCLFACVTNDPWPFIGNLPPCLSFFFCTTSALRLCESQRMAERLELLLFSAIVIVIVYVVFTLTPMVVDDVDTRRRIARTVSPLLTCWQATAPSIEALSAIRRRDARLLSKPLSIAGMACSSFWVLYGVAVVELSIWLPNAMLMLLSAFNLTVKVAVDGLARKPGRGSLIENAWPSP
jgi:hypothetical protein